MLTGSFINSKSTRQYKLENQITFSAPSLNAMNTFEKNVV